MKNAWDDEPNELAFEHNGYKCQIWRVKYSGHLCGYVAVGKSHRLYGKGYGQLYDEGFDIEVHCGLTFASLTPTAWDKDSGLWWFGFDCNHSCDLAPKMSEVSIGFRDPHAQYRTIGYVKRECESLADQFAEINREQATP